MKPIQHHKCLLDIKLTNNKKQYGSSIINVSFNKIKQLEVYHTKI